MRRPVLTALLLLTARGVWAAGFDEQPIPQNPAKQAQFYKDHLERNRRTLVGAYEKVGKKSPKWDRAAREALEAAARMFGRAVDPTTPEPEVYKLAKRAVDAGCDDPMVLYVYARTSNTPNYPGAAEYERRMSAAADALLHSTYPPQRRAVALQKAGSLKAYKKEPSPEDPQEAARLFDAALAIVPQGYTKAGVRAEDDNELFTVLQSLLGGYRRLLGDYPQAFERIDAVLAKWPAMKVVRLQLKGYYLTQYAWEARGSGLASEVTPEGLRLFKERLTEADAALRQSWALQPADNARTPTLMLPVSKGLNTPRAEMETWFRRAMEADGNNYAAVLEKMDWLDPKWHGSTEALLAFGRACRATKNWRAAITLAAADAHLRVARGMDQASAVRYMARKEVWETVHAVYEEYLSHYPDSDAARTPYAALCCMCGHYEESVDQFEKVGDNLWASPLIPLAQVKQLRDYAARKVEDE